MITKSTTVLEQTEQSVVAHTTLADTRRAVISVRNIGKMYRMYTNPQDRLKQMLLWRFGRNYGHEFWAVRNVSFDIMQGEAVGIIGRNGSGKSTLLQIIAGTLAPTEGEVQVQGRVAALLELGSGFNPEFTGRENVFLNGSILGISREEMESRFDEIAAFADIGEFIEQPVKMYSSGMAVRLAFAVQAIVPKDVLIVDEALAVGDEAFQRKCMRTLEEFRKNGGTVLLVTHGTDTIVRHCERCLFLHSGEQMLLGPSKEVTDIYQRFSLDTPERQKQILDYLHERGNTFSENTINDISKMVSQQRNNVQSKPPLVKQNTFDTEIPKTTELVYGTGQAEIIEPMMLDTQDNVINVLRTGETYRWQFRVIFFEKIWNVNFGMMIRSVDGVMVAGFNNEWEGVRFKQELQKNQLADVNFTFQANLAPGMYFIESGVIADTHTNGGEGNFLHRRVDICAIRVVSPDNRRISGLAYLQPQISVRFSEEA